MNFETKVFVLTLIGAVALAAFLLYVWDLAYTKTTGKPAAERVRERTERLNRPLTPGKYWGSISLYLSAWILFIYLLGWGGDFRRGRWIASLGWLISASFGIYHLEKRRRRQQADEANQPSGGAM
jgi:hypothetical protein